MTQLETKGPALGAPVRIDGSVPVGSATAAPATRRLPLPSTVNKRKIQWTVAVTIIGIHLLGGLLFFPWLFSWSGLALALIGVYVFGTLGINICYHRLLTHRSFKTPKWLEYMFAVFAQCSLQGSPAGWVAAHRMHHQHSDEEPDPHSPLVNFFWSHLAWMFVDNEGLNRAAVMGRYARDIVRDPFYMWMEKRQKWVLIFLGHVIVFPVLGALLGWAVTGTGMGALQLGLSWLVWGVVARLILVWHITWSVNSVTHLWGYRNYKTGENSRNNWIVALLSNGEGWHNNHHADQRSAAHGHRWWEIDVTYLTILFMKWIGLASAVVKPDRHD